jgi:AcrR family transcriptional regulator
MGAKAARSGRNREATRNTILEATSQLIAEKGLSGFTMSEVAARGRINRALIYHYFQNRDNLVFETIRHVVHHYEAMNEGAGTDALERSARMHIEHPEISRFLFHLLLDGQPIPRLSSRLLSGIRDLEAMKQQAGRALAIDPTFAVMSSWLIQISWSIARGEISRQFGLTPEEADQRLIDQMRRAVDLLAGTRSSSSETR